MLPSAACGTACFHHFTWRSPWTPPAPAPLMHMFHGWGLARLLCCPCRKLSFNGGSFIANLFLGVCLTPPPFLDAVHRYGIGTDREEDSKVGAGTLESRC